MSKEDPTPTPLARLLDEHWQRLLRTGGAPTYLTDAEGAAFYRAAMRKRARAAGVEIRTAAAKGRDRIVVAAWLPNPSEEQEAASREDICEALRRRPLFPPQGA